jgi:three-Cys-motif partner protein
VSIKSNKEFFGELREWSERKLKILEQYLDPFVKVLGSLQAVSRVYYIDAFAGEGLYQKGEKGSSVRAAELAQQYEREGKPYHLKCINIEADQESFENLQANTAVFGDLTLNLYGPFTENIDRVLAETRGYPALFFLDPFGVKGINWDLIRQIIHRGSITDLWIRFDHIAVRRLNGLYKSEAHGAQKGFSNLCDIYGIPDQEFLHALLSGQDADERKQKAVNLYMGRLTEEFQKTRQKGFVAAYPVRSITKQDKYSLIFATGNVRGAIIASELICSAEETYQQEIEEYKVSQTRQPSLFSLEPSEKEVFDNKVSQLAESMWEMCKGLTLSRPEVYEQILSKWFGKIRSTHVTNALKKLQKDGRIEHATGAPSNRKTHFTFQK